MGLRDGTLMQNQRSAARLSKDTAREGLAADVLAFVTSGLWD
jgi:hypothetical protein